jgi:hypothetical protein
VLTAAFVAIAVIGLAPLARYVPKPAFGGAASADRHVGQSFAAIASGVPMPLQLMPRAFCRSCRARKVSRFSLSLLIAASGVGQFAASVVKVGPPAPWRHACAGSGPPSESQARAVGHCEDKDSLPLVARADFCRTE